MKMFLARIPTRPLDRPTAWACVAANLLVLPGLGSWILGRVVGLVQMALSVVGFGLTLIWAFWLAQAWLALKHLPADPGPHLVKAVAGVLLFAAAWFWALFNSITILRGVSAKTDS
jgi:hypothetical protein